MAYDLAAVIVLLLATWRGAVKGFVWQLATIAALVLAFCFAGPLSGKLAPMTGLKSPLDRWVSLLVLYILFSFGCFLLARALKSGIEKVKLEDYDRHLGALFGFLKGGVICLVATFFAVTLWPASHPYILGSHSGYAAAVVFDELRPIVPDEYHGHLDDSLKKLGQCGLDPANPFCPAGDSLAETLDGPKPIPDVDPPAGQGPDPTPNSPIEPVHQRILDLLLAEQPVDEADVVRASVEAALAGVDDDRREEMIRDLEFATPRTIASLLDQWHSPSPVDAVRPTGPLTPEEKTRRRDLLFEIARLYTQFPAAQQSIVDEVAEQLRGVPPRVQLSVLDDWHADLRDAADDPDSGTSPVSPLDQRIERQLELAKVPLDTLDQALRDRLSAWR